MGCIVSHSRGCRIISSLGCVGKERLYSAPMITPPRTKPALRCLSFRGASDDCQGFGSYEIRRGHTIGSQSQVIGSIFPSEDFRAWAIAWRGSRKIGNLTATLSQQPTCQPSCDSFGSADGPTLRVNRPPRVAISCLSLLFWSRGPCTGSPRLTFPGDCASRPQDDRARSCSACAKVCSTSSSVSCGGLTLSAERKARCAPIETLPPIGCLFAFSDPSFLIHQPPFRPSWTFLSWLCGRIYPEKYSLDLRA